MNTKIVVGTAVLDFNKHERKLIDMASIANDNEFISPDLVRRIILSAARAAIRRIINQHDEPSPPPSIGIKPHKTKPIAIPANEDKP